jgi:hypothetical protein
MMPGIRALRYGTGPVAQKNLGFAELRFKRTATPQCLVRAGSKSFFVRLRGMSPNKEYYRARAEECCRMAILADAANRRAHWLEAAARWISLGREQGVLLPRRTASD